MLTDKHTDPAGIYRLATNQFLARHLLQDPPDAFLGDVSKAKHFGSSSSYRGSIMIIRRVHTEQLDHDIFSSRDASRDTISKGSSTVNGNLDTRLQGSWRGCHRRRHVWESIVC